MGLESAWFLRIGNTLKFMIGMSGTPELLHFYATFNLAEIFVNFSELAHVSTMRLSPTGTLLRL